MGGVIIGNDLVVIVVIFFFFSQTLHEFSIYHWKRRNIKP